MAFDPDRYLATKTPSSTGGFNPDAYLGIADRGNIINTDVPTVVGTRPNAVNPQPAQAPRTMGDYVSALYEVPAVAISSFPAAVAYGYVPSGSSPEVRQAAEERAARFQITPKSPVSQDVLQTVGEALTDAKIPPFIPVLGTTARATQQAGRTTAPLASGNLPSFNQATQAVRTAPSRIADLLREREVPLSGVGAAEVPEVMQRVQLGRNLRVPIEFSKGEATRDLGQQAFEAEIPKSFPEIGKPILESKAQRNENILQNFDAYVDATGKETFGLGATGKVVDKALVNQVNRVKQKINEAYELARTKGETQEPVDYSPLTTYIEQQTPTVRSKLAPILDAVNEQIKVNDPQGTGQISINQLEDIYQFINKNFDPTDAVANTHVRQMKNLINTVTEGKGGENYQAARALRTKFGREFENIGVIDKLLRTKKGTDDRAVAFEDVFRHSVLDGSLEDVQAVGRTLKKAGPEGEQAWRELQGQTIEYIKDQVTRNVDTDMFGNSVVSPAKYKSIVRELDQDGKLDYLFGKKGAQEIRDLLEATILVNAPVKGAVNQSNTASAFIRAMDKIKGSPLSKLPLVKSAADYGIRREMKKQVEEALNFDPQAIAKELKKGK
jgi:hypothetical protein